MSMLILRLIARFFTPRHDIVFALTVSVVAIAVVFGLLILVMPVASPSARTGVSLHFTKLRIKRYFAAHQALPARLEDAPRADTESIDTLKDAWGRQIIMRENHDRTVSLTSFGRDGKPGGL